MALLIGPYIHDPDVTPAEVVLEALRTLQPALGIEHIQVVSVHHPQGLPSPIWRAVILPGSPPILDEDIETVDGVMEDGHWRPTGPAGHPTITRAVAVSTSHGWVVAATDSGTETAIELAEQALAHVAAVTNE